MVKLDGYDLFEYPQLEYVVTKVVEFDNTLRDIDFSYFDDMWIIQDQIYFMNYHPKYKIFMIVYMNKHNEIERIKCTDIEEVPRSNTYYDYCRKVIDDCIQKEIDMGTLREEYERINNIPCEDYPRLMEE